MVTLLCKITCALYVLKIEVLQNALLFHILKYIFKYVDRHFSVGNNTQASMYLNQIKIILETTIMKILKLPYCGYSEAIITWIESVEQGYYKACSGVICKKLNEFFHFYRCTMSHSGENASTVKNFGVPGIIITWCIMCMLLFFAQCARYFFQLGVSSCQAESNCNRDFWGQLSGWIGWLLLSYSFNAYS